MEVMLGSIEKPTYDILNRFDHRFSTPRYSFKL